MPRYAILSSDGLFVEAVATAPVVPEGALLVSGAVSLSHVLGCMVVGGELVPRPRAPRPYIGVGSVEVLDCPPDTLITVFDVEVGEVLGSAVATASAPGVFFSLPDRGRYQVEVSPPHPFLGCVESFEVK